MRLGPGGTFWVPCSPLEWLYRWFRAILGAERFSYAELDRIAGEVVPGCEGLTFLPYIVGERSPIMDARARGGFVGLALRHGPEHMARALLEGVAFALRQIIEAMEDCGASLPRLVASGNGLGSPLWRQMLADVIQRPLFQGQDAYASERAGVGAAMIGGIGAGIFKGYDDLRSLAPSFDVITAPNPDRAEQYESRLSPFSRSLSEVKILVLRKRFPPGLHIPNALWSVRGAEILAGGVFGRLTIELKLIRFLAARP